MMCSRCALTTSLLGARRADRGTRKQKGRHTHHALPTLPWCPHFAPRHSRIVLAVGAAGARARGAAERARGKAVAVEFQALGLATVALFGAAHTHVHGVGWWVTRTHAAERTSALQHPELRQDSRRHEGQGAIICCRLAQEDARAGAGCAGMAHGSGGMSGSATVGQRAAEQAGRRGIEP